MLIDVLFFFFFSKALKPLESNGYLGVKETKKFLKRRRTLNNRALERQKVKTGVGFKGLSIVFDRKVQSWMKVPEARNARAENIIIELYSSQFHK